VTTGGRRSPADRRSCWPSGAFSGGVHPGARPGQGRPARGVARRGAV